MFFFSIFPLKNNYLTPAVFSLQMSTLFWQRLSTENLDKKQMITAENKWTVDRTQQTTQYWTIPCPSLPNDTNTQDNKMQLQRIVAGECPICMRPYECGEDIVWSSNPNCIHTFHAECILAWMAPWKAPNRLCPCCRQPFLGEPFLSLLLAKTTTTETR